MINQILDLLTMHNIELFLVVCLIFAPIYICFTSIYFWIEKRKKVILSVLFFISFFGSLYIYTRYYALDFGKALYYSLTQFTGDIKTPVEIGLDKNSTQFTMEQAQELSDNYYLIYFSGLAALFTTFLTVLIVFFKEGIQKYHARKITKMNEYTVVIGLGENNHTYIESELRDTKNIIVVEKDRNSPYIEYFQTKGIGVLIGPFEDHISLFEKNPPEKIVISVGNDRHNIDIASICEKNFGIDGKKEKYLKHITIYIHLEDQNFEAMYQQRVLSQNKKNQNIEFRPFSFYDDAARNMCMKHTVLGNYIYCDDSDTVYNIVIAGEGKLAERIVYHLSMLAHLAYANQFNFICLGTHTDAFLNRLHARFRFLGNVSSVSFQAMCLDIDDPKFYTTDLWERDHITNIILCNDDENVNLKSSVELYDKVFLKQAKQKNMKTKILIAMYHNLDLGEIINDNCDEFKSFYTFGAIEDICSKEYLVNQEHEALAQLIHYGYGAAFDTENENFKKYIEHNGEIKEEILKKWRDHTVYSDRESSRSQALHIDTKLLSLGLMKKKVSDDEITQTLLDENIDIFYKQAKMDDFYKNFPKDEISKFSEQLLLYYDGCDFDDDIINDLYKKLIESKHVVAMLMRSEHERWNAFHYLNGWTYQEEKIKEIKEHNCLTALDNFMDVSLRMTIIYDLYSVLYIPNYLSSIGYRIVPVGYIDTLDEEAGEPKERKIKIGITGHRYIDIDGRKLKETIHSELKKIIDDHDEVVLYSPLAEGSDRLFVTTAFDISPQKIKKLVIPMPFGKETYINDFEMKRSKDEFIRFFEKKTFKNSKDLEISSFVTLLGKDKDESYFNTGKCVVNKSDLLVVLWNGEEARGVGGTGDIVKYAKEKGKPILYINTDSLKVEYINFEGIL